MLFRSILFKSLQKHGFDVVALHGDMAQAKRTETLDKFRANQVRLLVASDVAARGLDIQGLSHVFNFDVPIHAEDYVHRIGRTGRAGNLGRAFTLATPDDGRNVAAIIKLIGKDIPAMTVEGFDHPTFDEEGSRKRGRGARRGVKVERGDHRPARRTRETAPVEAPESAAVEPIQPRKPRREAPARVAHDAPVHSAGGQGRHAEPIRMGSAQSNVTPFSGRPAPRRRHEEEDDERVIGFGDHQPAFLMRPVRAGGRR